MVRTIVWQKKSDGDCFEATLEEMAALINLNWFGTHLDLLRLINSKKFRNSDYSFWAEIIKRGDYDNN